MDCTKKKFLIKIIGNLIFYNNDYDHICCRMYRLRNIHQKLFSKTIATPKKMEFWIMVIMILNGDEQGRVSSVFMSKKAEQLTIQETGNN